MSDYLTGGVDIGSTTAKAVILKNGQYLTGCFDVTGTSPAAAGQTMLEKAAVDAGYSVSDLGYIVATGYGRVSASYADKTITEITCHGKGAHFVSDQIKTVIDIGGQDAKVISIDDTGKVIDFVINDKCASGTGRFLESAAQLVLHVDLKDLGTLSADSTAICKISSMCTVFAQTEIISLLASGESKENIIAGLHASIASRVGNMANRLGVKPQLMMTGGVAKNSGVRFALAKELSCDVITPDGMDPQLVGALGAALIGYDLLKAKNGS